MERKTKTFLTSVAVYLVGLSLAVIGIGMCTYRITPFPAAVGFFGIFFIYLRFSYTREQRKKRAKSGAQAEAEEEAEEKRGRKV
jgi:uncharacterized membrane protein